MHAQVKDYYQKICSISSFTMQKVIAISQTSNPHILKGKEKSDMGKAR
jgi:hypothetical protein